MYQSRKYGRVLAFSAALVAVVGLFLIHNLTRKRSFQVVQSKLMSRNAELNRENDRLKNQIADLETQNDRLKKYLLAYEKNFVALNSADKDCRRVESGPFVAPAHGLNNEGPEIRHLYREMWREKKRWDRHLQVQYKQVLERTVEPRIIDVQRLDFNDEGSREYFLELEDALKLHRRLIRDVRLFHDEIQYQKEQLASEKPYQLYDLKFKLAPFARESALVDALQQAMSALSAGIYQQEAQAVLDRIGDELTEPIRQLYENRDDETGIPVTARYPYSMYTVYGKKLIDYSDTLVEQSSITLGPFAMGELDFFNRQMFDRLYDLYSVGQENAIDQSSLDFDELEKFLFLGD